MEALRTYGRALGMAFQIVDDILDLTGDAETLGKPVGGDLLAGTLTLPAILLMEADPRDNAVRRLFAADGPEEQQRLLRTALDEIAAAGILDRAAEVARQWQADALRALEPLAANEHRRALESIAAFVTRRRF